MGEMIAPYNIVLCPKCGSEMVWRKVEKNGKEVLFFWCPVCGYRIECGYRGGVNEW